MSTRTQIARGALALAGAAAIAIPTAATALPAPSTTKTTPGPDAAVLGAHLLDQELAWFDCVFTGTKEHLNAVENVACADLTVPRDWKNPTDGKTITVRISLTKTAGADRQGIILTNPGGPGSAGLWLGPDRSQKAPNLAAKFDFVGMDPRGVGESTPFECTYVQVDPKDRIDDARRKAESCASTELAQFITSEQTIYDMDFVRAILGEDKLNYLGYSYGTWLGKWYETVFPHHSGRFVLDSATDVTSKSLQQTWHQQPDSRDRQFQERFLPYIARNAEYFGAPSDDPMELRRYWEHGGGSRSLFGAWMFGQKVLPAFYKNKDYESAAWSAMSIIDWGVGYEEEGWDHSPLISLSTEETRALLVKTLAETETKFTGAERDLERTLNTEVLAEFDAAIEVDTAAAEGREARVWDADFEAIRCQDGPWNKSQGFWDAWVQRIQNKATATAPFVTTFPLCRWWPNVTEMPKAHASTFPDTLIVQSELDAATPYETAYQGAKALPNTALISIDDEGTHGLYPYGTDCVDGAVEAYFLNGTMPKDKFTACESRPLPLETEVFAVGADIKGNGTVKGRMHTPLVRDANNIAETFIAREQADKDLALRP